MSLQADDVEHLVRSTVRSFTKGLRRLVEEAEAALSKEFERLDAMLAQLDEERGDLEEERARLEEMRARAEQERALVEEERARLPRPKPRVRVIRFADEVGTELQGRAQEPRVLRSADAARFLGEPGAEAQPTVRPGRPVADFLQASAPHPAAGHVKAAPGTMTLDISHRSYAVLPPEHPGTSVASTEDLKGRLVAVPAGWEVLSTSADGFEATILQLTAHGWGTPLLIVQHGGGFNTYRTPLSKTGAPGSLYKESTGHLAPEDGAGEGRAKLFRFVFGNGRLVICTAQADAPPPPAGTGRRRSWRGRRSRCS